jgi:hypothetical protein
MILVVLYHGTGSQHYIARGEPIPSFSIRRRLSPHFIEEVQQERET